VNTILKTRRRDYRGKYLASQTRLSQRRLKNLEDLSTARFVKIVEWHALLQRLIFHHAETAEVAIQAFQMPKVLILGGSSKRSDFASLGQTHFAIAEHPRDHRRRREWPRIKAHIHNPKIRIIEKCKTMAAIVRESKNVGKRETWCFSPRLRVLRHVPQLHRARKGFKREVKKLK